MASTPIGTVQGLASGIQWQDMIDQIIQADSAPITDLNTKISDAKARENAWASYKSLIQSFSDAASGLADGTDLGGLKTSIAGIGSGAAAPFTATTSSGAAAGDYQVAVTRLAAAEKLGGASFASSTSALGLAGDFLLNGTDIQVTTADSLTSIAQRLNGANTGSNPTGVGASVVATTTGGYRLVLTSAKTGAAGIGLADGSGSVLRGLGLLDGTVSAKNALSNGLKSDGFADAATAVGSLLKLSSPPLKATVVIGGVAVDVDLSTDSLTTIAANFTAAAAAQGKSSTLAVATDAAGRKSLQLTGPATFTDSGNILQLLGFVRGGRASVAQQLQGAALTDAGNGNAAATGDTLLTNLGAKVGDTIGFSGTRGDGSTVTVARLTIGAGTKVSDVLAALNDASTGFGAGARPATASIVNGRLTLTDGSAGDSLLSLSVVAGNETGGTLDFGALAATTTGQSRQITAGADALITVDGTPVQRSGNAITDAIPGVTLNLSATSASPVVLSVARDTTASIGAVKSFVAAYNKVVDFVAQQTTAPAEGQAAPPLYGDSVMRSMRTTLNASMQKVLASGVAGSWARLGDIGITIDKTGHYQVDDAALGSAVAADPTAIQRLFGISGSSASGAISYVTAGDRTKDADYSVQVSHAATQASASGATMATGAGTMTVTDRGTGKSYTVALTDQENASDIATALNAEFAHAAAQVLAAGTAATDAGTGKAVTDATTWASAKDGGSPLVASGSMLTVSGTKADGSAFTFGYSVSDTATLGDFRSRIQQQLGADASVTWDPSGKLTVTAPNTGSSLLTLAVTSSDTNDTAPFGTIAVATQGRPAARLTAATDGSGKLTLTSADYGSAAGFTVAYSGTDAGIVAGTQAGSDVVGTINGQAATGSGQTLTGATGTDAEGLMLRYTGADNGSGTLTFSRGIGSAALLAAQPFLGSDAGSIQTLTQGIDDSITGYNDRIDTIQARLDRQRQQLTQQFTAMEQAIAKSQSQMQWLTGQINGLAGYGNTSSSK